MSVVVAQTCHPGTLEMEPGESQVPGQPGLHSEALSPKIKEKNEAQIHT
jgi:hypothetical protein